MMWRLPGMGWGFAWLIPSNVVTFLVFCLDKVLAIKKRTRVPESVLLSLALTGGLAGALSGMAAAHHKTASRPFRTRLQILVFLELIVVALWLFGGLSGLGLASPWAP